MIQLPNLERVWSGLFEGCGKLARILQAISSTRWKPTLKDTSTEYPIFRPSSGFWLAVTPARDPLLFFGESSGKSEDITSIPSREAGYESRDLDS
jgi:hypothetical protein